jgi:hypothetical protein
VEAGLFPRIGLEVAVSERERLQACGPVGPLVSVDDLLGHQFDTRGTVRVERCALKKPSEGGRTRPDSFDAVHLDDEVRALPGGG